MYYLDSGNNEKGEIQSQKWENQDTSFIKEGKECQMWQAVKKMPKRLDVKYVINLSFLINCQGT